MSNRIIKDAIWKSKKLALCSPLAQLHYPRLYLLIDDWSCFEVDLEVIKGKVYPKFPLGRRPLAVIDVILAELAKKGLLFTWSRQGKKYAYFTGDESGRLPRPSKRHQRQTPEPPHKELAVYINKFNNLQNGMAGVDPNLATVDPFLADDGGLGLQNGASRIPSLSLSLTKEIKNKNAQTCENHKSELPAHKRIKFNWESRKWEGISDEDKRVLREAYPACDIEIELKRWIAWALSKPKKGKKTNYLASINYWLSKSQDAGGTKVPKEDWKKHRDDQARIKMEKDPNEYI